MEGRQHLTKLQQMCIGKTKFHGVQGHKIICIPVSCSNQLQMAPSLMHLTSLKLRGWPVYEFDGVETLPEWLGSLTSLTELRIGYCKNLTNLPSVQTMQRLTKLQSLRIEGCRHHGADWVKSLHIPQIITVAGDMNFYGLGNENARGKREFGFHSKLMRGSVSFFNFNHLSLSSNPNLDTNW
ncbi:hypothetical protein DVH24_038368 [Malus domestica]|uniref:R13L1/DRL21-like LRR repeat region domain-containing protein n=1 Tax=Malus domestica TaxID=3750 RepID=A0A498KCK0_MALDO|nr:hypothetical protein DVH24_038368 [Malus domestica]